MSSGKTLTDSKTLKCPSCGSLMELDTQTGRFIDKQGVSHARFLVYHCKVGHIWIMDTYLTHTQQCLAVSKDILGTEGPNDPAKLPYSRYSI